MVKKERHANEGAQRRWAVPSLIASAFCMSLMTLLVKEIDSRIPIAEVILARSLLGVVLNWWLLTQAGVSPWGNRKGLLFWRGLTSTGALFANFASLSMLPLGSSTILQYLYPTFVGFLAWVGLREQISNSLITAIALGLLGVVVVAQPTALFGGATALPWFPVLIGICGALLTAITYVIVRSLATFEHPLVVVFYFSVIALPISIPFVWANPVIPTYMELLALLGIGVFTQLSQYFLTIGFKFLPATIATSISYVQVFFAVILGWLLLGEEINNWDLVGTLLVLAASLISSGHSRRVQLPHHRCT